MAFNDIFDTGEGYYYDPVEGQTYTPDQYSAAAAFFNSQTADVAPMPGVSNNDWVNLITKVAPLIPSYITAFQLSQINVGRARAGLPALNTTQYSPQIGVGLTANTSQLLMYGVLAIGAVMLIGKRR